MASFDAFLIQGEDGYLTLWSIVHALWGYFPHLLWTWAGWGPAWISLYVVAVLACVFELVENKETLAKRAWNRAAGRAEDDYRTDTLENAVSDVLCTLVGWGVVQLATGLSDAVAVRWALLVAGLCALGVFIAGFFLWRRRPQREAAPTGATPCSAPRIRFRLGL